MAFMCAKLQLLWASASFWFCSAPQRAINKKSANIRAVSMLKFAELAFDYVFSRANLCKFGYFQSERKQSIMKPVYQDVRWRWRRKLSLKHGGRLSSFSVTENVIFSVNQKLIQRKQNENVWPCSMVLVTSEALPPLFSVRAAKLIEK